MCTGLLVPGRTAAFLNRLSRGVSGHLTHRLGHLPLASALPSLACLVGEESVLRHCCWPRPPPAPLQSACHCAAFTLLACVARRVHRDGPACVPFWLLTPARRVVQFLIDIVSAWSKASPARSCAGGELGSCGTLRLGGYPLPGMAPQHQA